MYIFSTTPLYNNRHRNDYKIKRKFLIKDPKNFETSTWVPRNISLFNELFLVVALLKSSLGCTQITHGYDKYHDMSPDVIRLL